MKRQYPSREEVYQGASKILARGILKALKSDPREAAERAYISNVTPSVEELEARIREMQARYVGKAVA